MARRPWIRMSSAVKSMQFLIRKYIKKKRISCYPSAAAIVGGSEDLVTEILALLPIKTVARLKLVSKEWLSLISSEYFSRLHTEKHGRPRDRFVTQLGDEIFTCDPTLNDSLNNLVRVSLPIRMPRVKILQSWDGLFLLCFGDNRTNYAVFNPTTQGYNCILINLDGPPPLSIHLVSDPSQQDYCQVLMVTNEKPLIYYVYDSSTHQWSHEMDSRKNGCPFSGDALGYRMSDELSHSLRFSCLRQGIRYHVLDSNERQVKPAAALEEKDDHELQFHPFIPTFAPV